MSTKQEKPEERVEVREKLVKYVGLADVRVIRKDTWQKIGIEHDDVVWSRKNHWKIPAKDLSDAVLEYCQHDRELMVVEE